MYIMGTVLRHGSGGAEARVPAEDRHGRPAAAGLRRHRAELRLRHHASSRPPPIRKGDRYVVNGQKIFISRVLQSDLMLLLARTTPVDQVKRRTDGLSVFLIDIRDLKGFEVRPLRMMMNHSTNALFFDNVEIPAESLIGEEGKGFSYILDGMNAERILVASTRIGDGALVHREGGRATRTSA